MKRLQPTGRRHLKCYPGPPPDARAESAPYPESAEFMAGLLPKTRYGQEFRHREGAEPAHNDSASHVRLLIDR
jgi:hypothetical protein